MASRAAVDAVHDLDTPRGPARATVTSAGRSPRAVVVLGHGAGGGIEAPDLVALARALPERGMTVVRVEQPWRVSGRKAAAPPPQLDDAWLAIVPALRAMSGLGRAPLVVGGRSAGARVACRTASGLAAVAVVCLAFPLHPPGRPEASRAGELLGAGVPTLVVQGERDPFGGPDELPPGSHTVLPVAGADHSLRVPKGAVPGPAETLRTLAAGIGDWVERTLSV